MEQPGRTKESEDVVGEDVFFGITSHFVGIRKPVYGSQTAH